MILEGLVSSRNADGTPHLAPMGPRVVGVDFHQFQLKPFPSSQTYKNLLMCRRGVLHITDDALLIAKAAIGIQPSDSQWHLNHVDETCPRLKDCHLYYDFQVISVDTSEPRVIMTCEVIQRGQGPRAWFGFNRARHSVLEAAILATRVHLLPRQQIENEYRVLQSIVDKTGGRDEQTAMHLLLDHVRSNS